MRRVRLLVVVSTVAFVALVATGRVGIAAGGSVTPLKWDQASQGLPGLVASGRDVWINAIAVKAPHSVYRVDPGRATVYPTPLSEQFLDLFVGKGALWGSAQAITKLRLYWVDVAHGFRLEEKAVPDACEFSDGGHSAVWDGRLWLTCSRFGIYAFTAAARKPVQAVPFKGVEALLPASNGLWAATKRGLRGIAGASKGAVIALPSGFAVRGDYASNVGWAVAGTTAWAVGYARGGPELVHIDLRRRTATAFPIVVPGLSSDELLGFGVAIAGRQVLVADSQRFRLIRYNASRPRKPVGFIQLPGTRSEDTGVTLVGGTGAAWATLDDPTGIHIYRVTVAP
jgi:hypothetical protein